MRLSRHPAVLQACVASCLGVGFVVLGWTLPPMQAFGLASDAPKIVRHVFAWLACEAALNAGVRSAA